MNNKTYKIVNLNELPAAEEILSEKELAKYNSFRIEKRKREWLGGRFAAKSAIWDRSQKSEVRDQKLRDIEITRDKYGRPIYQTQNSKLKIQNFLLSISHSGKYAVAAAKNSGCNFLGIDIEKTEQRHPLWEKDYFHETEILSNAPEFLTELWTKKEALLKALGLGMKADPLDIVIGDKINLVRDTPVKALTKDAENVKIIKVQTKDSKQSAVVQARPVSNGVKFLNKALARYQELGEPDFIIKTAKFENYIVSHAFTEEKWRI
ncbi:MAG: 4'-phosphopantetheinyl transferase superfamily protein [Elusimicrobia bacterium]|nr:4'-phosphopantetheinyl transferase superfamily protein [Elusimicrobiota bacterium]